MFTCRAHVDIGGMKPTDPTLHKVLCLLCWRDIWAVGQAQQGHTLPHQVVQLLDMLHHHQWGQCGLVVDANCTIVSEGLSLRLCVQHKERHCQRQVRRGPIGAITYCCMRCLRAAQGHVLPAACGVWPIWVDDYRCLTAASLACALRAGRGGPPLGRQLGL